MKRFHIVVLALLLLVNLMISQPAWADRGKFMKTPEYTEVTQAIADLSNPSQSSGLKPEVLQQKLADLRFQKYILEMSEERSQCLNNTGKALAIYGRPMKTAVAPVLYTLASGQRTDEDVLECVGIYLPSGSKVALGSAGQQDLTNPLAFKIVPGTQFVAEADASTEVIQLNAPAQVFKSGEIDWLIPTLSQAEIDTQIPPAPIEN